MSVDSQDDYDGGERRRRGPLARLRRAVMRSRMRAEVAKITLDRDLVMAALFAGLLFVGMLVALSLYQQHLISRNQNSIHHQQRMLSYLERRDRVNSYQAAYRFCTRESIDRAAIHWFLSRRLIVSLPKRVIDQARRQSLSDLRRMERKDGMPVLDCNPNTVGDPARYLPVARQREFVDRWRRHALTPAEIGICKIKIGALVRPGECIR